MHDTTRENMEQEVLQFRNNLVNSGNLFKIKKNNKRFE